MADRQETIATARTRPAAIYVFQVTSRWSLNHRSFYGTSRQGGIGLLWNSTVDPWFRLVR